MPDVSSRQVPSVFALSTHALLDRVVSHPQWLGSHRGRCPYRSIARQCWDEEMRSGDRRGEAATSIAAQRLRPDSDTILDETIIGGSLYKVEWLTSSA